MWSGDRILGHQHQSDLNITHLVSTVGDEGCGLGHSIPLHLPHLTATPSETAGGGSGRWSNVFPTISPLPSFTLASQDPFTRVLFDEASRAIPPTFLKTKAKIDSHSRSQCPLPMDPFHGIGPQARLTFSVSNRFNFRFNTTRGRPGEQHSHLFLFTARGDRQARR